MVPERSQMLPGPAPANFLQVYSQDILNANDSKASIPVVTGECSTAAEYAAGLCATSTFPGATSTMQELLNMASQWLARISEQPPAVPERRYLRAGLGERRVGCRNCWSGDCH
jgi:hypothetical protein